MKNILIYPSFPKIHSSVQLMINNPPEGYNFVYIKKEREFLTKLSQNNLIKSTYSFVKKFFGANTIYQKLHSSGIPPEVDLIYSMGAIVPYDFPWVVEIIDSPYSLAGNNYDLFIKNKDWIEKKLLSPLCKKIVIVNEASMKLMKKHFSKEVLDKSVLIRAGIKPNLEKKVYSSKKVQIIFMGSLSNPNDFLLKGGIEALEVFSRISKKYPYVNFIFACKIPKEFQSKCSNIKNLKVIEEPLSKIGDGKTFQDSDIMLNPGHVYILMSTLEAMSYGIPIVFLDTYGVQDYIEHLKTGILVKPAKKSFYFDPAYPSNARSKQALKEINLTDNDVINNLTKEVEILIENPSLREKLGMEAKKRIDEKFSLKKRSNELKKLFDEILQ